MMIYVRDLYPDEITPNAVSQQEFIRKEWTTYIENNNWYDLNKKNLIEIILVIDTPMEILDGTMVDITIGEEETTDR